MSNLKWQSVPQLQATREECLRRIDTLQGRIHNEEVRLEWIDKYIEDKSPAELTVQQIGNLLGYKVKVVHEDHTH